MGGGIVGVRDTQGIYEGLTLNNEIQERQISIMFLHFMLAGDLVGSLLCFLVGIRAYYDPCVLRDQFEYG